MIGIYSEAPPFHFNEQYKMYIHQNRSIFNTLPYVHKTVTSMHSCKQAHCLLPKAWVLKPPSQINYMQPFLIIYKLTCNIIHKIPIKTLSILWSPKWSHVSKVTKVIIKLTKCTNPLSLFISPCLDKLVVIAQLLYYITISQIRCNIKKIENPGEFHFKASFM